MENLLLKISLAAGIATAALFTPSPACAQTPTSGHVTKSDLSTSTNWSEVVFPGDAQKRIVLKSLSAQVESATNQIDIFSGTMPLSVFYSLNSTQLVVLTNSFVTTNQWGILQFPGSNTAFVVNIQLTNVYIGGPGPVLAAMAQSALLAGITNTNCILWACTNRSRLWTSAGAYTENGAAIQGAQIRAPLANRVGSGTGPVAGNSNQVRRATVDYVQ